ncbi:MAG TPA: hypothetical protein ENI94_01565 [Gammaproteobacteria bacterium]|nr:hypothetical protein [Gammaproteobacteria bacterium]
MLRFSEQSEKAIGRIKQIQGAANVLSGVLASSVLLEIFAGNRVLGSANNIRKKDWEIWAKAMRAVPNVVSREINFIAQEQLMKPLAMDERNFWRAVADGCR